MSEADRLFTDGEAYERMMGRWSRRAGDAFLDWLALPGGLRWLDAGCGNGAFTETLVTRCQPTSVTGLDPSPEQIDFARARASTRGVDYHVGDAQALPFGDAAFDAAVMALVISFIPDPAKAVAELKRVTRPRGCVATYMWDFMNGGAPSAPIAAVMQEMGLEAKAAPGSPNSRMDAMEAFWRGSGLDAVETRVIPVTVEYADFDDYWAASAAPIGVWGIAITRMPPDQQAEFRARLRASVPTAVDGRIVYEARANAVKGFVPA